MSSKDEFTTRPISSSSYFTLFLKIHYFLWFSSLSGVLPYYVVYVRTYTLASASWIGILFSLLPFIAFFSNPFFCFLADRSSNHFKYLLLFLGLTGLGYGTLLVLPAIQGSLLSWLLSLILLLIAYPSMATVTSLTDSIVMMTVTSSPSPSDERLTKEKLPTFGQIRVWGTIGYGIFGFLSGPVNSFNFGQYYLGFGFIMFIIILSVDFLMVTCLIMLNYKRKRPLLPVNFTGKSREGQDEREKINEEETDERFISRKEEQETLFTTNNNNLDDNKCQMVDEFNQLGQQLKTQHWKMFVSLFLNQPTIIQHSIVLIGQGVLMACHWSYFYWFLETISGPDTGLMGLTLLIGCFCGELVFFYFGNSIVNKIGPTNAFNVSLISFIIQYLTYAYLIRPGYQYLVCLTEILQGPTFGLFYTAMTHIGQQYADKQSCQDDKAKIHATLQGFLSGCLEGLGLGLGSLGAGLIIDHYSVQKMWILAASLATIILIFNSSSQLLAIIFRAKRKVNWTLRSRM